MEGYSESTEPIDAVSILPLARFEPPTSATPPSTTPDIDAANCATETSPKKDVQEALIFTTTDAVHVVSIRDCIYTVHYQKHCVFFIHSTVFLFVNLDGIYVPPSNWLHTIWIYFVCYDLKEFVFGHYKAASLLKEYFHALEMDKTQIYEVFTY